MSLDVLSGSHASIMSPARRLPLSHVVDQVFHAFSCQLADVGELSHGALGWDLCAPRNAATTGTGIDTDASLARLKAVCEAAERYCGMVLRADEYRIATAEELGTEAFNWTELPRLSSAELALPKQPYRNFDPREPMRWVPAWDALARVQRWVPVVLTHLYPRAWSSERFWYPISTGMAVHVDPWQALTSAIAEVVERDAIALTWLLQRPLRRIALHERDARHLSRDLLGVARRQEFRFYDATTDFGLPVVYLQRHRPQHPHAANLVTCAADISVARAVEKALREMVGLSTVLEQGAPAKAEPLDCTRIEDGVCYMARPQHAKAFEFLDGGDTVALDDLVSRQPRIAPGREAFDWSLTRARQLGWDVLLTELTVDEVAAAGLRCFRAVLPQAMPMTTDMRCRFLDSPRLPRAHQLWNLPGACTDRINPHPQPFA